ncbi:hypothetical protein QLX08_006362 [Tetragonisca angustula]|uniref:Uncharacterized protein n=1 Tax=Tetragonisca angustula TaxID=166442 RepID=A0AAW0ZVQ2_9HYME
MPQLFALQRRSNPICTNCFYNDQFIRLTCVNVATVSQVHCGDGTTKTWGESSHVKGRRPACSCCDGDKLSPLLVATSSVENAVFSQNAGNNAIKGDVNDVDDSLAPSKADYP